MEREPIFVAHCPTCDKYTEQVKESSGVKYCFVCHTPYSQSKA